MSILELVLKCCLLFFLGGAARIDYLKRELPLIYSVVGFGVGLLLRILSGTAALAEILPGFIPGLLCLLIAKLSKESIGYGDAFMLIAIVIPCYYSEKTIGGNDASDLLS